MNLIQKRDLITINKILKNEKYALDELCDNYKNLVYKIANKYTNRYHPIEDLMNVGYIGLINSVYKYKNQLSNFTSWAYIYIRGYILTYINKTNIIRFNSHIKDPQKLDVLLNIKNDKFVQTIEVYDKEINDDLEIIQNIISTLSGRKKQIGILILQGLSNKDIAEQLNIRQPVVREHKRQLIILIKSKLNRYNFV